MLYKFLLEQLNLKGWEEVAIPKKCYPSIYQNATERNSCFWYEKTWKNVRFLVSSTWFTPPITNIVEAMNTLVQARHNHIVNCSTVKVFQKCKKLECTSQIKKPVIIFLVRTSHTFLEGKLALNLEYCWEKKDSTNQNMLTTLSAYAPSWYTQTRLSIIWDRSSQLQIGWVLSLWKLLRRNLQRFLVLERISKQQQKLWENELWGLNWLVLAGKRLHGESIQQNLQNNPVDRGDSFPTIPTNHVK